jgi:hypothetical protein
MRYQKSINGSLLFILTEVIIRQPLPEVPAEQGAVEVEEGGDSFSLPIGIY